MTDGYETILYEVEDPVALITLNRPQRLNAWTMAMGRDLHDALRRAATDRRVVGVVITGAGRAFCAGGDLKDLSLQDLAGLPPADPRPASTADEGELPGPLGYMVGLPKPVIAAVNGPAVGMGAALTLWADLRFMADEAFYTMAFSQRGTVAESASSWLLPRLVGPAAALDLLFSSRRVAAAEALRLGLVNRTAPAAELVATARDYIVELARTCSPASMATIKRQVRTEMGDGLAASTKAAGKLLGEAVKGDDLKEGWQAFLEKRPPSFARIGNA